MEIRIGEPIQGQHRNIFKIHFTVWNHDGTNFPKVLLINKGEMEKYKDFLELIYRFRSHKTSSVKLIEMLSQIEDRHNFNFGALHCIVTNTGKLLLPVIDQITFFDEFGIERSVKMLGEKNNNSEFKSKKTLSPIYSDIR